MGSQDTWIYGINSVKEALVSDRKIKGVYVSENTQNKRLNELLELAIEKNISVKRVKRDFFKRFRDEVHQNVCALAEIKKFLSLKEILVLALKRGDAPLFILLDRIEDPRNLGAILRVAEGVSAHGVIFHSHGMAGITPLIEKASSGASQYIPLCRVPNIKHAIRFMKENGIIVIGTEADSHESLWDTDLTVPVSIVFGSEGKGLRRTVRENCDKIIHIPLKGKINSLNVSVASGIILFESLRQRLRKRENE